MCLLKEKDIFRYMKPHVVQRSRCVNFYLLKSENCSKVYIYSYTLLKTMCSLALFPKRKNGNEIWGNSTLTHVIIIQNFMLWLIIKHEYFHFLRPLPSSPDLITVSGRARKCFENPKWKQLGKYKRKIY